MPLYFCVDVFSNLRCHDLEFPLEIDKVSVCLSVYLSLYLIVI